MEKAHVLVMVLAVLAACHAPQGDGEDRVGPGHQPRGAAATSAANSAATGEATTAATTTTPVRADQGLPAAPEPSPERLAEASAARAKSIVALQAWRRETVLEPAPGVGVTWTDLAPHVGVWHLVSLEKGGQEARFHLQLAQPESWRLVIDPGFRDGPVFEDAGGRRQTCELWPGGSAETLRRAAASGRALTPVCDGRLFVRVTLEGRKSNMEWTTDFLRDNLWGGEKLTVFVRSTLFKDKHLETAVLRASAAAGRTRVAGAPAPARLVDGYRGLRLEPGDLGLALEGAGEDVAVGRWLAVKGAPGVYAAVAQPRLFDVESIDLRRLDEVEASALVYLVAFDLDRFDLVFAVGTDHPRLGWSERTVEAARDPRLPGPDGFDVAAPFERTGRVPPDALPRLAATFTGGFKRSHGAFKWGRLSLVNGGHHYGLVEEGVVWSRLRPDLATVVVWRSGEVDFLTWTSELDSRLGEVRYARQNGPPLVDEGPGGEARPGELIYRWSEGNWSGSQDQKLRSVRAGACLQESEAGRFLVYGYFSGATPAAMARTFLGYGCRYALLLDMNALEHTYLALMRGAAPDLRAEHLVRGMEEVDPVIEGTARPRFVARADNRDFFYLTRKETR